MFNIIARSTLLYYVQRYPETEFALRKLYNDLAKAGFQSFNDLKRVYGNASIVGDSRVIFNVMGNKYRLVVRVNFQHKRMMIKWFGTHREYDSIQVETVEFIPPAQ